MKRLSNENIEWDVQAVSLRASKQTFKLAVQGSRTASSGLGVAVDDFEKRI